MASSSSIRAGDGVQRSFEDTCEAYGVDSRLLYNDIEQLSNKRFYYTRQLVNWSRLLAVAAVAAAGVGGLAAYYQRAQIHRVWRIRNPHRVRQLSLTATLSGGFSLCTVLFLISPIGLMRLHDNEVRRTQELDAIAVAALVQEQNFRTLAAWWRQAPLRGHATTQVSSRRTSQAEGDAVLLGTAAQWVWKEVVLDPTQLLAAQEAATTTTTTHAARAREDDDATDGAGRPAELPAGQPGTEESGDAVRAGVDAAKKKMAAELLLFKSKAAAETTESSATADDGAGVNEERERCNAVRQRRVWTRTSEEAELQAILAATVEMWESLVKAKTDILAKVL